ncbi:MAG TPA: hypothetical protein VE619_02415 [Nitrososphaeraceae archaeon]|nr:hypothetical protein [Nitrososphaeraceae archaeon]
MSFVTIYRFKSICNSSYIFLQENNKDTDKAEEAEEWKLVSNGLPEPSGTIISILAAEISWNMSECIQWPKEYLSPHL